MHLSSLRITNFRNFTEQRLEIPPAGVAIVGDNGHGKTNLLEAIYYLEIFRSFRGAHDDQLARFGEDVFRVEGRVATSAGARVVAAAYDRRRKKKKVTVDAVERGRLADALGKVGVVVFSPSDVALVSGSPAVRRRFLDILLSLAEPRYLEHLQRYRQALLQRNALLRAGETSVLVAAWDDGLIRSGSRIVAARHAWITANAGLFAKRVAAISGGSRATLEYEPALPLPSESPEITAGMIEEIFRGELTRLAERERRRGATLAGPHRDDVGIRTPADGPRESVDLRTFGSGGQQRTAAVALRMVEAQTLRLRLDSEPIILLDDVFAELDVGRSHRILEWVEAESRAQVILTAPKPADFALRGGSLQMWRIENGAVSTL